LYDISKPTNYSAPKDQIEYDDSRQLFEVVEMNNQVLGFSKSGSNKNADVPLLPVLVL
jgi:hypothetical protein